MKIRSYIKKRIIYRLVSMQLIGIRYSPVVQKKHRLLQPADSLLIQPIRLQCIRGEHKRH